jgi:predicted NBD/HSP70 family sugar kinase
VAQFTGTDESLRLMIDYLSAGLANAVNFVRPHRLVLVSDMIAHGSFTEALLRLIRSRILPQLAQEVKIDLWQGPATQHAETAGWLALASLYREGWETTAVTPEEAETAGELAPTSV